MNVIQVLDRPASQSFYAVAGRLLFVQSLDPKLATLIERLCAGWQLTPVSRPERSPDINITFTCSESLPQVPAGLHEFEVAEGGRCYSASHDFYLAFVNSLLHVAHDADQVRHFGHDANPVRHVRDANSLRHAGAKDVVGVSVWIRKIPFPSAAELARVTSFAVCAALRRFGTFELHGAGVVPPGADQGVLIVGPSGSGKSTLTTQLARAGWSYLSDDELLLTLTADEVEARGFRSFFALADSTSPLKNCFEPAATFTAPRTEKIAPRFVFFTKIRRAKDTQLHKLTQAETMSRLIRACPWATYDTAIAGRNLKLLSRLARQTQGFDLLAGTDLLEPDRASQIVGAVCRA